MQEKELEKIIKNFYENNKILQEQQANILSKLPMSKATSSFNVLYKLGVGLLGIAVFAIGFLIAMPQKALQYAPDSVLQYIPAKTQVAYVQDQEKELDDAKKTLDEVNSLNQDLDAIDAELSAIDNLQSE